MFSLQFEAFLLILISVHVEPLSLCCVVVVYGETSKPLGDFMECWLRFFYDTKWRYRELSDSIVTKSLSPGSLRNNGERAKISDHQFRSDDMSKSRDCSLCCLQCDVTTSWLARFLVRERISMLAHTSDDDLIKLIRIFVLRHRAQLLHSACWWLFNDRRKRHTTQQYLCACTIRSIDRFEALEVRPNFSPP